jgi:hypothetical protein
MILSGGRPCASGTGKTSIFVVGANRGSAGRGGISHMVRLISLNTTLLISYSSHNVEKQRAGMRSELEQCLPIKSNEAGLWPVKRLWNVGGKFLNNVAAHSRCSNMHVGGLGGHITTRSPAGAVATDQDVARDDCSMQAQAASENTRDCGIGLGMETEQGALHACCSGGLTTLDGCCREKARACEADIQPLTRSWQALRQVFGTGQRSMSSPQAASGSVTGQPVSQRRPFNPFWKKIERESGGYPELSRFSSREQRVGVVEQQDPTRHWFPAALGHMSCPRLPPGEKS